jgi:hypothetical protein
MLLRNLSLLTFTLLMASSTLACKTKSGGQSQVASVTETPTAEAKADEGNKDSAGKKDDQAIEVVERCIPIYTYALALDASDAATTDGSSGRRKVYRCHDQKFRDFYCADGRLRDVTGGCAPD